MSAGTVGTRLSVLKSFFTFASEYSVTGEDGKPHVLLTDIPPTTGIHPPQRHQSYRTITYADFEKLMQSIPKDSIKGLRARSIILLLFWTARRRAEVCGIVWGDIYHSSVLENGVRRQVMMFGFYGKGHSRQKDFAELPSHAYQALVDYLTASGRIAHMRADSPLFVSTQHTGVERALSAKTIWYIVKHYARLAGVDMNVHTLRHVATQQRALAGESIFDIQKLLRHRNLSTTSTYLQGLMGTTDPAAKLLEEKFGKF